MKGSPLLQSILSQHKASPTPAKVLGEALRDLLAQAPRQGPESDLFKRVHHASGALSTGANSMGELVELGMLAHQALAEWCLGYRVDADQLQRDLEAGKLKR